MKVQLKKRSRIWQEAGEIVEVSPAEASFLISVGAAQKVGAEKAAEIPEEEKAVEVETAMARPKRTAKKK